MKLGGPEESSENKTPAHQHLQGQPSHVKFVVEKVFLTLDYTVTGGAVTSGAQKLFYRLVGLLILMAYQPVWGYVMPSG